MDAESRLQLLEQVQLGDRIALGKLLEDLRPYLRVVVRRVCRDRCLSAADDSDLIQDVFVQATQHFDLFRGTTLEEWLGWLRTITVRTTQRSLNSVHEVKNPPAHDADFATLIIDKNSDPHLTAVRNETADRMALALAQLPDDMQQVLLGRLADGLDYSQIAAQNGRSSGAIRMLYLRALRKLSEIWQSESSSVMGGI